MLRRFERDDRELIVEQCLELVVSRDREVALRLNDQEARRHPDLESTLLGVHALLGQLAAGFRRLDPLPVLLETKRRRAHFTNSEDFVAAQTSRGLIALEPRPREVRFGGAVSQRIAEREAERPGRIVVAEHLSEDAAETRVDRTDHGSRKTAFANQARSARSGRVEVCLHPQVRQGQALRQRDRRIGDLNR